MKFGKGMRLPGIAVSLLIAAGSVVAQDHRHLDREFTPAGLPPMTDAFRPVKMDDVKRYWITRLPRLFPPSRSSSGYAYEMPHYRERLDARNCLIESIQKGTLDERAECEALRHNIRYYRKRGNGAQVEALELELLRREAVSRGDLGAVVRLEELKNRNNGELETRVREQQELIRDLQAELAALKQKVETE